MNLKMIKDQILNSIGDILRSVIDAIFPKSNKEVQKSNDKTDYTKYLGYIALAVCLCVYLRGCSHGDCISEPFPDNTDATVGSLKGNSSSISIELGKLQDGNREAQNRLEGSLTEIRDSRNVIERMQIRIANLERNVEQARMQARGIQGIIDAVDEANR